MSRQIYNSAWRTNSSLSYEKASIIVPTIKSLQRLLPNKEVLLDALIMLPLFAALLIVILSF